MHTSANRERYTNIQTNFDKKRIQRSLYLYENCDRNLKKVFLYFLAVSGVNGESPGKRRVDVSGVLAKRQDQRDKKVGPREREMAFKEQQLFIDQQKFEAGKQERRKLLKFLMDKIKNEGVISVQWLTCC